MLNSLIQQSDIRSNNGVPSNFGVDYEGPVPDEEIGTMVLSSAVCHTQCYDPPTAPLIPCNWKWSSQPKHKLHISYAGQILNTCGFS